MATSPGKQTTLTLYPTPPCVLSVVSNLAATSQDLSLRGKGINPAAPQAAGIPGLFWHLHFLRGCFPPCQHQLFPSSPWAPSRSSVNARQDLLSAPEPGVLPQTTAHQCLFVSSLHLGIFYANSVKSASFQFSFMQ